MKKLVFLMMALAGMASTACAQSLEEARQLMKGGAYAEAQEMLDYLIASSNQVITLLSTSWLPSARPSAERMMLA